MQRYYQALASITATVPWWTLSVTQMQNETEKGKKKNSKFANQVPAVVKTSRAALRTQNWTALNSKKLDCLTLTLVPTAFCFFCPAFLCSLSRGPCVGKINKQKKKNPHAGRQRIARNVRRAETSIDFFPNASGRHGWHQLLLSYNQTKTSTQRNPTRATLPSTPALVF